MAGKDKGGSKAMPIMKKHAVPKSKPMRGQPMKSGKK